MKPDKIPVHHFPSGAAVSDAELLKVCDSNPLAFDELLLRHGPLVYHICRGSVASAPDAEDAFQMTFLILYQRAKELREPAALAGWLCGVATRVARRLRQQQVRYAGETAIMEQLPSASSDPSEAVMDQEARATIWEELGILPAKYRDPLVLCYVQELTTEQAAGKLGCPVGTLRSRLLKARELLGIQLRRRGVTVSVAAILLGLSLSQTQAAVPPELLVRTKQDHLNWGFGKAPRIGARRDASTRTITPRAYRLNRNLAVVADWLRDFIAPLGAGTCRPTVSTANAGTWDLLVVSQSASRVSLLDPATGQVRKVVETDACPHEVAVSANGLRAAVSNYGLPFGQAFGTTLTIIDIARGEKLRTIPLGANAAPHGLAWLDERRLLCTLESTENLAEIDTDSGQILRRIRTEQPGSHMVAARGLRAFTTNFLANSVSSFDLQEGVRLQTRVVGQAPEGIALSPDGTRLWVANRAQDTISVLDTKDLSLVKLLPAAGMPMRLAFKPDGRRVAVSLISSDELVVFDAQSLQETRRIPLRLREFALDAVEPSTVVFSADSKTAYCTLFAAQFVVVIDVESGLVTQKFPLPDNHLDGLAFSPIGPGE